MEYTAPGVVKLFGEHSVVYGRLAVAAAISLQAKATVEKVDESNLVVTLADLQKSRSFTYGELVDLRERWKTQGRDFVAFAAAEEPKYGDFLPYAFIASRLLEQGVQVLGKRMSLASDIPIQKGLGSSGAMCTVFTVALVGKDGVLKDDEIIDVARDGERIRLRKPGAGGIDVSTSYYGGVVTFRSGRAEVAHVNTLPEIVLIDTGPKLDTNTMVGIFAKHVEAEKARGSSETLDSMDKIANLGLEALYRDDLGRIGTLMAANQQRLKSAGVSSDSLDRAVDVGLAAGALGVKLTGGGGGGMAIAVTENPSALIIAERGAGFDAYAAKIKNSGAKSGLLRLNRVA